MLVGGGDHLGVAHRTARLDHGADAGLRGRIDAVAEGEERIAGHHRARHDEPGLLGLEGGDLGADHAAHLAGADAHRLRVLGVDDGVRLHVHRHLPGEHEVGHFLRRGLALRDDAAVARGPGRDVGVLHQQATGDALVVERGARRVERTAGQHAHVGLLREHGHGLVADHRRDHHFDELALEDLLGGAGVERAVEGDDAAEGRGRVGGVGAVVGGEEVLRHGHAAGVGVLDDHAGRLVELLHAFQCGVGVGEVVVAELLALEEPGGGDDAHRRAALDVERTALVRVLAVAQLAGEVELQVQRARPLRGLRFVLDARGEPHAHLAVVAGGMGVALGGIAAALRGGGAAGGEGLEEAVVVGRVGEHRDAGVVLRRRAQHGRSADVDVLDGVLVRAIGLRDRRFERVEVHHQQVDGFDAVLGHDRVIGAGAAEQATVHFGVQGLDAAVHDLREAGDRRDVGDGETGLAQGLRRAAGGEQDHALRRERLRQRQQAGLVGNGQQGPADGLAVVGHAAPSAHRGRKDADYTGRDARARLSRAGRAPRASCAAWRD